MSHFSDRIRQSQELQIPDNQAWAMKLTSEPYEIFTRTKKNYPELFDIDTDALAEILKEKKHKISATVSMLRIRFWDEYSRAEGRDMIMDRVYGDVCSAATFYRAIRDPYNLAWIAQPPASFTIQCDHFLELAMQRAKETLAICAATAGRKGTIDTRLAQLQFQMLQYFDQKKNGAIIQRTENRSVNLTATITDQDDTKKLIENMSEEELNKKLEEMRAKADLEIPPVIEVKKENADD